MNEAEERMVLFASMAKDLGIHLVFIEPFNWPLFVTDNKEAGLTFVKDTCDDWEDDDAFAGGSTVFIPGGYFVYVDPDAGVDTWFHEALHVAASTCASSGIEYSVRNDEYMAYMQGYIADIMYYALYKKHLRKMWEVQK